MLLAANLVLLRPIMNTQTYYHEYHDCYTPATCKLAHTNIYLFVLAQINTQAVNIEEILVLGARLQDISSGSQPYEAVEDAIIDTKNSLHGSIQGVASALKLRQNDIEISQIEQAVEAQVCAC